MTRGRQTRSRVTARFFVWGSPLRLARLSLVLLCAVSLWPAAAAAAPSRKARVAPDLEVEARTGSPARVVRIVAALEDADAGEVARTIGDLGGRVRGHFRHAGAMALELPLDAVEALAAVSGVRYLAPDREVRGLASFLSTTTGASLVYPGALSSGGYDGTGVAVAVVDSGVDAGHWDLIDDATRKRRVVHAVDFTARGRIDDYFGHGTHVAGVIAGDGSSSSALGTDLAGIAPGASLVDLRVLDDYGRGYVSNVVAAIDYAISVRALYRIRVINLSLAAPPIDSYADDPICRAVARATAAGIVVVAAAGNFGEDVSTGEKVYGGITSPGNSPSAITVGAARTHKSDVRSDDQIAPFSSRGPTLSGPIDPLTGAVVHDFLPKPDLVAPGARVVSLERDENYLVKSFPDLHVGGTRKDRRYMMLSGTSMSAAVASGAAALVLQANPSLTPNMVKAILMYTAQMMDGPDLFEQGAGLLNIEGAVRLAASLSPRAAWFRAGQRLVGRAGLPDPQSVIAGETFPWSRSLVWGTGALRGEAMFTTQQEAYAQSLIWGISRLDAWGAGVTWYDGLYSDSHVAFGQGNEWNYVTWDSGTTTTSGLIWSRMLYASGVTWQGRTISSDFLDASPSSLIWGGRGYDSGLIWGISMGTSLIWGGY